MKNKNKNNIYGIIGLGRFGSALASRLAESGKDVIVVDRNEAKVKPLCGLTDYAYVTDNLSKDSLEDMGFADCGTVIICIGEEIDVNILTTLSVLNLGVKRVIAKAQSLEHGAVLEKIGAEVVYPERDMALRLASNLLSNNMLEFVALTDNVEIMEVPVPPKMAGKKISELPLRKKYGLNIIALERGGATEVEIDPQRELDGQDMMIVIGNRDKLVAFNREYIL